MTCDKTFRLVGHQKNPTQLIRAVSIRCDSSLIVDAPAVRDLQRHTATNHMRERPDPLCGGRIASIIHSCEIRTRLNQNGAVRHRVVQLNSLWVQSHSGLFWTGSDSHCRNSLRFWRDLQCLIPACTDHSCVIWVCVLCVRASDRCYTTVTASVLTALFMLLSLRILHQNFTHTE